MRDKSPAGLTQPLLSATAAVADTVLEVATKAAVITQVPEAAQLNAPRRRARTGSARSNSPKNLAIKSALLNTLDKLNKQAAALSELTGGFERRGQAKHLDNTSPLPQRSQAGAETDADVVRGKGGLATIAQIMAQTIKQPDVLVARGQSFVKQALDILQAKSSLQPARHDHRFRDAAWRDNRFYRLSLQFYLAAQQQLEQGLGDLDLSNDDHARGQFILQQLVAAGSPSNWLLHPAAVKRSLQTGGRSRLKGLRQLVDDWQHNGGMPHQARADAYQVGADLAVTAGQVVYRNDIFELIEYSPLTSGVWERPVFLIPPQINKYYIFDLSPNNSMVRFLLEQGLQVFVVSWRVPGKLNGGWDLDSYVAALEQGLLVARDISQSNDVNLVSACAGGLTAMALIGYLDQANKKWVHTHSLFVTSLQPVNHSVIELFLTRRTLELSRAWTKACGVLEGKHLSRLFMWLRPNDLVWNFWVNNYLMGKEPPSLDVTFWDADSTCLPAGLHSDFIDMYLHDVFRLAERLVVRGLPIDFRQVKTEMFMLGGSTDYIMPWQGCYKNRQLIGGKSTFVLSDSGHIQAVLRPPGIANIGYFTNDKVCATSEQWLAGAERHQGSWWTLWSDWLQQRSGAKRGASPQLGNKRYPPLYPAPGKYVLEKV